MQAGPEERVIDNAIKPETLKPTRKGQTKILIKRIAKALKASNHCAVYLSEMERAWPVEESRQQKMMAFANRHGWNLCFYRRGGLLAIFNYAPITPASDQSQTPQKSSDEMMRERVFDLSETVRQQKIKFAQTPSMTSRASYSRTGPSKDLTC